MKGATNMIHRVMGVAVVALRLRMQWTQERLAHHITKISGRKAGGPRTFMQTISQWERHLESTSPSHRMALSLVMNLWRPPKA